MQRVLTEHTDGPEQALAKKAFSKKGRITDPTLIPKTSATPTQTAESMLDRTLLRNDNRANINDDIPTKQGKHWKQRQHKGPRCPRSSEHAKLLQPNHWMDDETFNEALTRLKTRHGFHALNSFFTQMLVSDSWKRNRKFFRAEGDNRWREIRAKPIPIDTTKPIIIPFHCGSGRGTARNHYIMAARFKKTASAGVDWHLAVVDSLNNRDNVKGAGKLIRTRTTLLHNIGRMDVVEPDINAAMQGAQVSAHKCCHQEEGECGFRTLLHILLAGTSKTDWEFDSKLQKLGHIEDLPKRCREWIYRIVTSKDSDWEHPKWIQDLISKE